MSNQLSQINDFQINVEKILRRRLSTIGREFDRRTVENEGGVPMIYLSCGDVTVTIWDDQAGVQAGDYFSGSTEFYRPLSIEGFVDLIWPEVKFYVENPEVRGPLWRHKLKKWLRSTFGT